MSDAAMLIQLELFDSTEPLPIQAANHWGFPLGILTYDGKLHYRVLDWLTGLVSANYAKQAVWDMRRPGSFFSDCLDGIHTVTESAPRHKPVEVEYVTDVVLYRITIRAQDEVKGKKREHVAAIHRYLAGAGAFADEARRNPLKVAGELISYAGQQRQKELGRYTAAGFGEREEVRKLRARHEGIATLTELKAIISRLCKDARFGVIFNAEYQALFGMVAKDLEALLDTTSIRDALPLFQLQMLAAGETALRDVLNQYDTLSNEEILRKIAAVLIPIGQAIRAISDAAGVHPVTGRPLLERSLS